VYRLIGIETIKYNDIFVLCFLINTLASIVVLYNMFSEFKIKNIIAFFITILIFAILFTIGRKYGVKKRSIKSEEGNKKEDDNEN
jgi:uncharacterized membrane protein